MNAKATACMYSPVLRRNAFLSRRFHRPTFIHCGTLRPVDPRSELTEIAFRMRARRVTCAIVTTTVPRDSRTADLRSGGQFGVAARIPSNRYSDVPLTFLMRATENWSENFDA